MMKQLAISALAVGVLALAAPAYAVDFFLIAKEFDKTLPDGTVKMWGFAEDPGGLCYNTPLSGNANSTASKAARMASAACTAPVASVPGPRLVAPPTIGSNGADRVRIRVVNLLDPANGGEPISLIIPGQPMPYRGTPGPTWDDGSVGSGAGSPGARRVRSFGRETAVDGGRNSYNWIPSRSNPLKDGTYLYHSGTHPQVQVQMGLYGAITRDTDLLDLYGISYDNEVTVLYSEIDPVLHDAVTSGTYGTTGPTSTIGYQPQYFLVNGEPFTTKAAATITGPEAGARTLLRLLNAGLQTHTPSLQGMRMSIIAEDGNVYPVARDEHSALLAPLKTKDAILAPNTDGTHALYDGMLNLSNTDGSVGGMLSFLQVGAGTPSANTAPVAVVDPAVAGDYDVNQNNTLTVAAPGVLGNDSDPEDDALTAVLGITNVNDGTLDLNADGSFVYEPDLGFFGVDSFTYKASDGVLESAEVTATITVVAVANNPPVADDQAVTTGQQNVGGNSEDVGITLTGSDVDLDGLTFTITGGPTSGILSGAEPNLTYTPNLGFDGADSFTYKANDGTADSLVDAVVDITVEPNQAPVADVDTATTPRNTPVTFSVVANDTDPDPNGTIDVTTIDIVRQAKRGTVVANGDGTVTYTPDFDAAGSDSFRYRVRDDDGELSRNPNGGTRTKVRVNITP
jgi:FtsP/CotA-like multicopper oxidase with cupredoxin domain